MNTQKRIFESKNNHITSWESVTLTELSENEEYLEAFIATNPEVLGFDALQEGIYGPYKTFRQLTLTNPLEKTIVPDIVLLSASGHVIIVEVKKYDNPELRDRKVISQIVDYTSAFTLKRKDQITQIFAAVDTDWYDQIAAWFPDSIDPETLADTFIEKMQSGKINMIIACDRLPHRLKNLLEGICKQTTLDYNLDTVEISLYRNPEGSILFVPTPRITTTVIGRTVVNVNISGEPQTAPSVSIQTTSLEAMEESVDKAKAGIKGRLWTDEELIEMYESSEDPLVKSLFEFTRQNSAGSRINSGGIKINPAFGFYTSGYLNDTREPKTLQIFGYRGGSGKIRIYFNMISTLISEMILLDFKNKIGKLFEVNIDDAYELNLSLSELTGKFEQFCSEILWIKGECEKFDG